jgi:hypothetical protein
MDAHGTWRVDAALTPGVWRLIAEFRPEGHHATMTLGSDAFVAGMFDPRPLPAISRVSLVGEYEVAVDGDLVAGQPCTLTLTVRRNGQPVTALEPYLAAYGHLVAMRVGDLAYLHVHPAGEPGDGKTASGPDVEFQAIAPSAGPYRLFLDFKHAGRVRTAEFTVLASGSSPTGSTRARPMSLGTPDTDRHGDSGAHDHH